jgi:hypothetical protein
MAVAIPLLVGAHGDVTLSPACVVSFYGRGCLNLLHHRRTVNDGVKVYSSVLKNKGRSPRVLTCAKTKICQLPAPINLTGVSCSGRLRRQTPLGNS